jgi:TfoX/Sxy family transcriptional regulator of competence genes
MSKSFLSGGNEQMHHNDKITGELCMPTTKSNAEAIAAHLASAGAIRIRSMMGEYLLYVDEVLVGLINDDQLFVKATPYGEQQLDESYKASPYPGAKPAFKIPASKLSDTAWIIEFVQRSRDELKKK